MREFPGIHASRLVTFSVTGVAAVARARSGRYETTELSSGVLVVKSYKVGPCWPGIPSICRKYRPAGTAWMVKLLPSGAKTPGNRWYPPPAVGTNADTLTPGCGVAKRVFRPSSVQKTFPNEPVTSRRAAHPDAVPQGDPTKPRLKCPICATAVVPWIIVGSSS